MHRKKKKNNSAIRATFHISMKIAVVLLVFAFYLPVNSSIGRWRRFKDGKFIIGTLVPVTQGPECKVVRGEGLLLAEALVHAVNVHNFGASPSDVTIGYDIRDSCSSPALASKEVLDILAAEQDGVSVGNCSVTLTGESCGVIAVVGPDFSNSTMATSGLLSAYGIPQVGAERCTFQFRVNLHHSLLCVVNDMQVIFHYRKRNRHKSRYD